MPVLAVVRVLVLALHRLLVLLLHDKTEELLTPTQHHGSCVRLLAKLLPNLPAPNGVLAPLRAFVLVLVPLLVLVPVLVRVYMLLHVRVGRYTCLCLLWCVCLCLRCTGCLCFSSTTRRTSCCHPTPIFASFDTTPIFRSLGPRPTMSSTNLPVEN